MHLAALTIHNLNQSIAPGVTISVPTLSIDSGRRVALLGLNGAGKTSLMKLLVGEIASANGCIQYPIGEQTCQEDKSIANLSATDLTFKQRLGYQADNMLSLMEMTGGEYLELCAGLKKINQQQLLVSLQAIDRHWKIDTLLDKKMRHLSKGNLQKLAIAQAFINNPDYLFFDEPCQSLDPLEQENFNQLIASLLDFKLCFFSTHNVEHALAVADDIILFHQSRMVFHFCLSAPSNTTQYLLVTSQGLNHIDQLEQTFNVTISDIAHQVVSISGLQDSDKNHFTKAIQSHAIKLFLPHKQCILPFFRMIASGEIDLTTNLQTQLASGTGQS